MNRTKVTFNGREIHNPYGRGAVMLLAIIWIPIGLIITLILFPIALVFCTLFHAPLRLLGRKGTFRMEGDTLSIKLDREAFRKK